VTCKSMLDIHGWVTGEQKDAKYPWFGDPRIKTVLDIHGGGSLAKLGLRLRS